MSNNTPTAARTRSPENGHWYTPKGEPCYEVPKKSEPGTMRQTTLADARKLNLLPSVTTILRILHKQALVDWLIEQAVLAVVTTPRQAGEADDAFIERVLHTERQQDQESQKARDLGTDIHAALESLMAGRPDEVNPDLVPWIRPAAEAISKHGRFVAAEKIVVGTGYAGKVDLIQETDSCWWNWDWKTGRKLPDPDKGGAWSEHRLQLAAYAAAFYKTLEMGGEAAWGRPIKVANCYISTIEQGRFVICEHDDWQATFNGGFRPLVEHWQWSTGYRPQQ